MNQIISKIYISCILLLLLTLRYWRKDINIQVQNYMS